MAKLTPKPSGPAWVLVTALAAAAPIASGCGDDDVRDAGADAAGVDAGARDASRPDAPGLDAGAAGPDAGLDAGRDATADADDDAFVGI